MKQVFLENNTNDQVFLQNKLKMITQRQGWKSKIVRYESEEAVRSALREICIFFVFLTATTIVALHSRTIYIFLLNRAVDHVFVDRGVITKYGLVFSFRNLLSLQDFWSFLELNFLNEFYGMDDDKNDTDYELKTYMAENVLLGPPRLRQIRVKENSCEVHKVFDNYFNGCYGAYRYDIEQRSGEFKGSPFYTSEELGTTAIKTRLATYYGAGFVKNLTFSKKKNLEIVKQLKTEKWIDRGTRLVVLEFTLYNGNTRIFDSAKFLFEVLPIGTIKSSFTVRSTKQHSIWNDSDYITMLAAVIFYTLIVYYTLEEVMEFHKHTWKQYVRGLWNIVDLIIILCGYYTFVYQIWYSFYMQTLLNRFENDSATYQSLDNLSYWCLIYMDMLATCVFLAWMKIFKFISFNKTMLQFSTTIRKCAKDLLGFGLMFFIVFVSYAQMGYLLFGNRIEYFKDFKAAFMTMVRMIVGDFSYSTLETAHFILGPIYFFSYILLVIFILLNMFIAIIIDTYSQVKSEITEGRSHLFLFLSSQCRNFWNRLRRKIGKAEPNQNVKTPDTGSDSVLVSESTTSTTSNDDRLEMSESDIKRNWFEVIPQAKVTQDQYEQLADRMKLMEEILEKIINDMDRILTKVDSKAKKKN